MRPGTADDDPEVRILVDTDVSMSRHEAAAQAVHAALAAFGIPTSARRGPQLPRPAGRRRRPAGARDR